MEKGQHHRGISTTHSERFVLVEDPEKYLHLFGWILLTISSFSLLNAWLFDQSFTLLAGFLLLISLLLVLRNSVHFGFSQSTTQLLQEERAGGLISSKKIHNSEKDYSSQKNPHPIAIFLIVIGVGTLVAALSWWVMNSNLTSSTQLVLFLVLPLSGLVYGIVTHHQHLLYLSGLSLACLMASTQSPVYAISLLVLIGIVIACYTFATHNWGLLLFTAILSYLVLLRWTFAVDVYPILYEAIMVAGLLFTIIFSLPFLGKRRVAKERELARAVIGVSCLFFFVIPFFLSAIFNEEVWYMAASIITFYYGAMGVVSWLHHQRFSYAKYYFLGSLSVAMIGIALISGHTIAILIWLLMSVLLLRIGFSYKSYSARIAGLATLGVAVVAFAVTSFVQDAALVTSYYAFSEHVVIGLILASFLIVVAAWYRETKIVGEEASQKELIINNSEIVALLIVLSLIWRQTLPPVQSGLFLLAGAGVWWWGARQKLPLVLAFGSVVSGLSLVKLLLIDTLSYPIGERIFSLFAFSLIMFIGAYFIQTKLRQ